MGFGFSNDAGRVMDIIDAAAAAMPGAGNEYQDKNGRSYFYEVARKDQDDGGIRGTIHRLEPDGRAIRVAYFHIDGGGRIKRAPGWMLDAVEASGKAGIDRILAR